MKVKKTAKTTLKKKNTKSKGKKSEEPIVKVLNLNVNPENPRNGFFELDWNPEFVNMLKQSGYQGESEEEIVDKWFQTLCQTIGNDLFFALTLISRLFQHVYKLRIPV
jgi:hypothetical protein